MAGFSFIFGVFACFLTTMKTPEMKELITNFQKKEKEFLSQIKDFEQQLKEVIVNNKTLT